MGWTDEQNRIIDSRDASILVSAAAGSGKTAVLVERILQKINDIDNPVNIDEFLVVTFTHAAADQMKEKIAANIEKALDENPDSEHLMKQLHLVNRADITTIDSFCLKLVKENFAQLGIDSSFAIGDSGMMELIRNDVLDEIFEKKYALPLASEERKNFEMLVDIFGKEEDDDDLKSVVLSIFDTASSFPDIDMWLENAKDSVRVDSEKDLYELLWMKKLFIEAKSVLQDALEEAEAGLMLCQTEGGPDKNLAKSENEVEYIQKAVQATDFNELRNALSAICFERLSSCKGDAYDEELVNRYKLLRNSYKEAVKSLDIIKVSSKEIIQEIKAVSKYVIPLVLLVQEFIEKYDEEKRRKRLVTFSDVEHLAHKLVFEGYGEDGEIIPSNIGKNISKRYKEIYIDEYQDSNYLQEEILCSVSRYHMGYPNMFMVGDIKQSIYKFRMARPDIFIDKYDRFSEEGNEIRIDLRNNFRSRKEVLNPVNFFFYQLMDKTLGGVNYDKSVALEPTKNYKEPSPEIKHRISNNAEICIIDANNEALEEDVNLSEDELNLEKIKLEAHYIADRILEIVDPDNGMYVYDEDNEEYKKAQYKDIVILSRSIRGFGENVYNVLSSKGIPVYLEEPKGYFEATEIKVIISLLSVCDNSRQDIPLAAVLLSPIGMLYESDMARIISYAIKQDIKSKSLYEKCLCYIEDIDDAISDKLKRVFGIIDDLKRQKSSISISQLIYMALQLTGYYDYVCAMPMGQRRRSNIDMLIDKAEKFENGYYKGLFNFLRYVDKLKINDMDFGEASVAGEDENVVRIVSMHKSKGLEYPIVFVSGLGKNFNTKDMKEKLIIHSDYFLTGYIYDSRYRYKKKTLAREAFKMLMKQENMSEELRVLYVALTRAKEKLIITACEGDITKLDEKQEAVNYCTDIVLPYSKRRDAKSYIEHIMIAMTRYEELKEKLKAGEIKVTRLDRAMVLSSAASGAIENKILIEDIKQRALNCKKTEIYEEYRQSFLYEYPYKQYVELAGKMSISDIKRMKAAGADYEEAYEQLYSYDETDTDTTLNDEEKLTGAQRGTIIHKFMELFRFEEYNEAENKYLFIKDSLDELVKNDVFNENESRAIYIKKIEYMLNSNLGSRMIAAALNGLLFKEQQFSAGLMAKDVYPELKNTDADDMIVVQGIIDAFFCEDNEIVVMDYKTDRKNEEELIGQYKAQLDYYSFILERLTGKKVKEKVIYSFYLDKEIMIV